MDIYKCTKEVIEEYQAENPFMTALSDHIKRYIPKADTFRRALDVGCGIGKNSDFLAAKGYRVEALDIDERILEIGRQRYTNPNITFRRCNLVEGDLGENIFDLIICSEVLEHIGEYRTVIDKLYRALKPNGRIILTVPSADIKCSQMFRKGGHLRHFDLKSLLLDLSDFKILKYYFVGFPVQFIIVRTYETYLRLFRRSYIPGNFYKGKEISKLMRRVLFCGLRAAFKAERLFCHWLQMRTNIVFLGSK
ncbi:MAG: class I SAM-dependent methyltransferase [Deltaproteobacteria bacterium]|nr:class I SAM-dependent methyltransferase [Deltaproteobacteria bacterium]